MPSDIIYIYKYTCFVRFADDEMNFLSESLVPTPENKTRIFIYHIYMTWLRGKSAKVDWRLFGRGGNEIDGCFHNKRIMIGSEGGDLGFSIISIDVVRHW